MSRHHHLILTLGLLGIIAGCHHAAFAQDGPDIGKLLLSGTTSIVAADRDASWRVLAQQPVEDVAKAVEHILEHAEETEFFAPIGATLAELLARLGPEPFALRIQNALMHTRSPKLIADLKLAGIGDSVCAWEIYEGLAGKADDLRMRQIAKDHLRNLTYASDTYVQFQPNTALGHYYRGCAYFRMTVRTGTGSEGELNKAIADLDKALELDRSLTSATICKAQVLKQLSREQEALRLLDQVIASNASCAEAYEVRGSIWRKLKNVTSAATDERAALEIRERERAEYLRTEQGLAETITAADNVATTAILLAAESKDAATCRAGALARYDDILKYHGIEQGIYYLHRALFHWYFGDGEAALRATDAFIDQQPRASYGHYLRARILTAVNDAQGSAAALREYQTLVATRALPTVTPPVTPTELPVTDLNFYTATDLAEKGEPGSITEIAQALAASNGDSMTRMVAADALGDSFDPQDVIPVVPYIEMTYGRVVDDPKFEPKAHVFKLVAKLKLASGPGFLAAAATADGGAVSIDAARQAVHALASYPPQTAVPYLEYVVGYAHRRETRVATVGALARLQKMSTEEVETRLILEGTRGQQVGAASAWGLREFGLLVLYEIATDPADQSTRQLALDALRQCGHKVAQRAAQ